MSTAVLSGAATGLRSGSWASGVVTVPPIGVPTAAPGIAGWVLEYIQPLRDWFDDLLGDPAQVDQVSDSWGQVERTLVGVADELDRIEAQLDGLEGRTIRTLQLRYEDLNPTARNAAEWSGSVAAAARLASSVVAGVRQFIFDFLDKLARLVGALFGFSLNPFSKIDELRQLMDAAAEFWHAGRRLIDNMFDAFEGLIRLLMSLGPAIEEAIVKLREAIAKMLPVAAGILGANAGGVLGFLIGGPLGAVLGTALGAAAAASFGAAAGDMLVEGGDVTRYDDDKAASRRSDLAEDLTDKLKARGLDGSSLPGAMREGRVDNLAELVLANSLTDDLGRDASTAFDIKLVRDANGNEHWIVSCASTQEWLDTFGTGAMNDRNTNLSLMFMDNPVLKSQYEAAALRAMREAGMKPGDPVVFTGFSQGGILAANFASDPNLPYNTIGVVTNGSPIDTFNIPSHIPVVAFQHANDPVAMLDGNIDGPTPPNVHRVVLPQPGGPLDVAQAHNNLNYASSIERYQSGLSEQYSWMGGEVIDHQVFEAVQR